MCNLFLQVLSYLLSIRTTYGPKDVLRLFASGLMQHKAVALCKEVIKVFVFESQV